MSLRRWEDFTIDTSERPRDGKFRHERRSKAEAQADGVLGNHTPNTAQLCLVTVVETGLSLHAR